MSIDLLKMNRHQTAVKMQNDSTPYSNQFFANSDFKIVN